MRLTRPTALACLVLGTLSIPACQGPGSPGDLSSQDPPIVGDWELDRFAGEGPLALPASARRPNLLINPDGSVYGLAGVNQYSSQITFDGTNEGAFSMGPIAATRMAGPQQAMDIENRFLESLQNTDSYQVDGDTLVLSGPDGELLYLAWQDPR